MLHACPPENAFHKEDHGVKFNDWTVCVFWNARETHRHLEVPLRTSRFSEVVEPHRHEK